MPRERGAAPACIAKMKQPTFLRFKTESYPGGKRRLKAARGLKRRPAN